jgi:hypothetical protein
MKVDFKKYLGGGLCFTLLTNQHSYSSYCKVPDLLYGVGQIVKITSFITGKYELLIIKINKNREQELKRYFCVQ